MTVVLLTHTVIKPFTMMIKPAYTPSTLSAMLRGMTDTRFTYTTHAWELS